jgi:hypothetical protein
VVVCLEKRGKKMKKKWLTGMALMVALASTFSACYKAPDPTIKEGRFDFSVTYEVDGEVTTVSSTYVCELAETGWHLDGWYIHWNEYMEDSELDNRMKETRGYLLLKKIDDGEIYLDLNLSAKYFMADPRFDDNYDTDEPIVVTPRLFIEYSEAKYNEIGEAYSEDVAVLEGYGVKVIDYEYDATIENTYKNL